MQKVEDVTKYKSINDHHQSKYNKLHKENKNP